MGWKLGFLLRLRGFFAGMGIDVLSDATLSKLRHLYEFLWTYQDVILPVVGFLIFIGLLKVAFRFRQVLSPFLAGPAAAAERAFTVFARFIVVPVTYVAIVAVVALPFFRLQVLERIPSVPLRIFPFQTLPFWFALAFAWLASAVISKSLTGTARLVFVGFVQVCALALAFSMPWQIFLFWLVLGIWFYSLARFKDQGSRRESAAWIFGLLLLFVGFRKLDSAWLLLGHSYVMLRCLSFFQDAQKGRVKRFSLVGFLTYLLFLPSFVAGPIDRYDRQLQDWSEVRPLTSGDRLGAWARILAGMFKKVVIVGFIAPFTFDAHVASVGAGALWRGVYAYSLLLYVDFSAYSDLAIGTGRLMGVNLPENFSWPYFQRNVIDFWNHWHMSLSRWLRDYLFFPVGQELFRFKNLAKNSLLIASIGYVITMGFCGLWHGTSTHFFVWGLYHGAGLAACKIFISLSERGRWGDHFRAWRGTFSGRAVSTLITFHFVSIGWLLFLYDVPTAKAIFLKMTGGRP